MEIEPIDPTSVEIADAVLALQRRAYRVEADLIGFDGIPPLTESLDELQGAAETFLGAFVDGVLTGVVSWRLDGDTIDVHRLAVDPRAFRRGVARGLLRAALAATPSARRAIVQTGAANGPARALYVEEGFRLAGEREVVPGLRVALFERLLD